MPSQLTRMTTDHDEIRRWAEARGAAPAEVAATEREGETGVIRLDFPGYSGAGSLKTITWDEWFQKFDESGLALVYQERTAGGETSNFNKLIGRETAEARSHGDDRSSRRSPRRRGGAASRPRASARSRVGRSEGARSRGGRSGKAASGRSSERGGTARSQGRATSKRTTRTRRQAPSRMAARLAAGTRAGERTSRGGKRRASTRGGTRSAAAGKGTRRSSGRASTRSGPRGRRR